MATPMLLTSSITSWKGIKQHTLCSPSTSWLTGLDNESQQPPTLAYSGGDGDRHAQNSSILVSRTVVNHLLACCAASLLSSSPTQSLINDVVTSIHSITMATSRPSLSGDSHLVGSPQMPTNSQIPKRLSMRRLLMSLSTSSSPCSRGNLSLSSL